MKRLLFLIALFASVVMATVEPEQAYYEGGTDHIIHENGLCRINSFPLNDYIKSNYEAWPFRPIDEYPACSIRPMYSYLAPKEGGGYQAFWSIRDSMFYLDSVTISAWTRSFDYESSGSPKIVSVRIPLQEIILNKTAEKKNEPLVADFVNGFLNFSCIQGYYRIQVEKGKVLSLQKKEYERELDEARFPLPRGMISKHVKSLKTMPEKIKEKKFLKLYRENQTPFASYYHVLDSLQQALDDKEKMQYIQEARLDSRFKRFEDFFTINAVNTYYYGLNQCYSFYVALKGKTPFRELILRLHKSDMAESFDADPVESVKLFLKTLIAVRKNPSFEKWLEQKKLLRNDGGMSLSYEQDFAVMTEEISKDSVWKKINMSGNYVATLQFGEGIVPLYVFMLSDNGDVLVSVADIQKGEDFFNITIDRFSPWNHRGFASHMKRCEENFSESDPLNLCDYVIIRHDGKIEYGPKSDLLNYWQRSLLPRKTSPLLPKKQ